ncbi:MAG: hypothetical protein KA715_07685 [Xanthomonadaceae bacterium]|nr:hypothetical protein [Xanthomonadaceae bacterium]
MSWLSRDSSREKIIHTLKSWTPGEPLPVAEIPELEEWFKRINQIALGEKDLWQGILNAQPDPACLLSLVGKIEAKNHKFKDKFGEGKRIEDSVRDPKVLETVEGVRKGSIGASSKIEVKISERFYKLRVSRLEAYVYCVFQDQTDLKHAIEDRSQLLSDIAHELRTPLTAILGFSQTLKQDLKTTPIEECASFIEIIARNAERLGVLVNEFLDLTRLESNAFKINREVVGVELLCAQVLDQLRFAIDEKIIDLRIDLQVKSLSVDKALFERAFRNVIENAIKYSPPKSKMEIRFKATSGGLRVEVQDEGPGIAKEFQERIFDRFFRIETSRARDQKISGSGLGLALVKRIVQAHGGTVGVESELGQGSLFWIELRS